MRETRAGAGACALAAVTLYCLAPAVEAGPPGPMQEWVTFSIQLKGPDPELRDTSDAELTLPECPTGTEFLLLGLSGGPELRSPSEARRTVGAWAISADFQQHGAAGPKKHTLTAYGTGQAHASASLGAGQPVYPGPRQVRVGVVGVSSPSAKLFRIDLTGACGTPSVR